VAKLRGGDREGQQQRRGNAEKCVKGVMIDYGDGAENKYVRDWSMREGSCFREGMDRPFTCHHLH
jgi:hypothetical protein